MKLKIFILALAFAGVVLAVGNSATLSWTLATAYIDGTPLPASSIKETLIQWRRPGSTAVVGSVRSASPATNVVVPNLVCGQFTFTAVTVLTTAGMDSAESSPVAYDTKVSCVANPPGALVAQ